MLCGEIASVQAIRGNAIRGHDVEDSAAAILHFESGALGTLVVSDAVQTPWSWDLNIGDDAPDPPQNGYHIMGTRGSLGVPSLELWSRPASEGWKHPIAKERLSYAPSNEYATQLRHFAAVIRGQEQPVVTGREGLMTLAATLAIHESAKSGKPVRIDEFLARR
jgi:predicted dehydrogenase